ncbi:hypothetical protein JMJ56_18510 [Belnapia sp. T18]|uniref:Bartonella effector protein BID domain-containing protein n=1 Tax=Belnapia arida TaxID=2804533 RepID=A0ABS1U8H2_9PROT|nr:hypothetical protein [Belnapia arida]MBL6080017.1 hypothetical protein [Belnapia arida]
MSVSINQYVQQAKLSREGNIRESATTPGDITNRGTFGGRVVAAFRNLGEALGFVQADATKAQRQQNAVAGFRAALVDRFGADLADAALVRAGIKPGTQKLTGQHVMDAVQHAKADMRFYRMENVAKIKPYKAPAAGQQASPQLQAVARALQPPVDLASLTPAAWKAFESRFILEAKTATVFGTALLTREALAKTARAVLRDVVELDGAGSLDRAQKARADFHRAIRDTIIDMCLGKDEGRLADRLGKVSETFAAMHDADGLLEGGTDDVESIIDAAVIQAFSGLSREQARAAQRNALAENSPLRNLYKAIDDAKNQDLTTNARQRLGIAQRTALKIVGGFASVLGPLSDSRDNDIYEVTISKDSSKGGQRRAATAVDGLVAASRPEESRAEQLVAGTLARAIRGKLKPAEATGIVRQHVAAMCIENPQARPLKILAELRTALRAETRLPKAIQDQFEAALVHAEKVDWRGAGLVERVAMLHAASAQGADVRAEVDQALRSQSPPPRTEMERHSALKELGKRLTGTMEDHRPPGTEDDYYEKAKGDVRLTVMQMRAESLLSVTRSTLEAGISREGFSVEEQAAAFVESFLRSGQEVMASPRKALDSLQAEVERLPADHPAGKALMGAIAHERLAPHWPKPL